MADTKTITIGNRKYQIKQMAPTTACFIKDTLLGASMKFAIGTPPSAPSTAPEPPKTDKERKELAEAMVEGMWQITPSTLGEDVTSKLQYYALKMCSYHDDKTNSEQPVLFPDGRITDSEIDASSIGDLIVESLKLSIGPIFMRGLAQQATAPTN